MSFDILAPIVGVIALLFAYLLSVKISKVAVGTDRMKEISSYIHEGAMAFLTRQYKALVILQSYYLSFWVSLLADDVLFVSLSSAFSALAGFFDAGCHKSECSNCECCKRKWYE